MNSLPANRTAAGQILLAEKNAAVLPDMLLRGLPNNSLGKTEYHMALPDEKVFTSELEHTRRILKGARWGRRNELSDGGAGVFIPIIRPEPVEKQ